jgi:hypothetical protein
VNEASGRGKKNVENESVDYTITGTGWMSTPRRPMSPFYKKRLAVAHKKAEKGRKTPLEIKKEALNTRKAKADVLKHEKRKPVLYDNDFMKCCSDMIIEIEKGGILRDCLPESEPTVYNRRTAYELTTRAHSSVQSQVDTRNFPKSLPPRIRIAVRPWLPSS